MRHGESQYNVLRKFAGWLDCELTADGIAQARQAGRILLEQGHSFDVAYSSELVRAADTLRHALEAMGLHDIPVRRSWKLNERHFGALDDLTREEAELEFGQETVQRCQEDFRFYPPVSTAARLSAPRTDEAVIGESMHDAMTRCLAYWNDVIAPAVSDGKRALVVTHGDILRLLTGYLLGMSEQEIIRLPVPDNASPMVFHLDDELAISCHYSLPRTVKKATENPLLTDFSDEAPAESGRKNLLQSAVSD